MKKNSNNDDNSKNSKTCSRLDERDIIKIFASRLGISSLDDAATISLDSKKAGAVFLLKSDMLVSSTDVPPGMEEWQTARKSIVSCVSDLAAKGAVPYVAMISLGIPKNSTRSCIEGLAEGFATASREFGVKIVGGDTNEAGELVIDCSMIGIVNKGNRVPPRNGARPGDVVVVSGMFGLPPAGLVILMQNAPATVAITGAFSKQAVHSVLEPMPRQRFGLALSRYFSSSIDSSDGLAISLYELAEQSSVDIIIDNVPAADGVDQFAKENNLDINELVFHGGEEYEIVSTMPRSKLERARAVAKKLDLDFNIIGRVQKGPGKVFVKGKLLEKRGYTHFG